MRTARLIRGLMVTLPLIVGAPLAAQHSLQFGPLAGLSVSGWHGADATGASSRTGLVVGAFVRTAQFGPFLLEPELLYLQKGAKFDLGSGTTGEFKQKYLEFPLLLKALIPVGETVPFKPDIFIGPALAFASRCRVHVFNATQSIEEECDRAQFGLKDADFSVTMGAGVDVGPIAIQGRYDLGLTRFEDFSQQEDIKNKSVIFTVGYRF